MVSKGKVLVTGGYGFIGSYLCNHLAAQGYEVIAGHLDKTTPSTPLEKSIKDNVIDVTDTNSVNALFSKNKFDYVYHLAALVYVEQSWKEVAKTFEVNTIGTINILEAIRNTNKDTKFILFGSGTEYGDVDKFPTPEVSLLKPASPYACSKASAEMACYMYWKALGIKTYRYRIFGITGIGKSGDVCNDFSMQVATAEKSKNKIKVGDITKKRDIMDIRDAVRAMTMVPEEGEPDIYNICSGETTTPKDILDTLLKLSKLKHTADIIEIERTRIRTADEPIHLGDNSKIKALGWKRTIPLEDTLKWLLDHWRKTI